MNPEDPDLGIRMAAFEHLRKLVAVHGPVLPWALLSDGFSYRGDRILFGSTPRGIHRPRQMQGGALSIKTTVPKPGRTARYDDQLASEAGHFVYKFQGDDPRARDNQLLHVAYRLQAPLIYLYGIDPGLYRPLWPVFITGWDPGNLQCLVSVDEAAAIVDTEEEQVVGLRRRYATVQAKKRLHQDAFRTRVLRAYQTRCAVCRLPRAELLDAAHILPDRDVRGRPEVPNGLSLCRLHHAAYDQDLMGIRPDRGIEIAPRLMKEHDGPVLEQALKGFHGRSIWVPRRMHLRPRMEYLEERFEGFRMAG
ncbi:MAG: HNH endonuclease [Deltaproteobacteria bacterium]|nr:HNH endonuclease [Deltaproteobacteria bacterium]